MLSLTAALARIKGRAAQAVPDELIDRLCREVGHRWRDRDLGPVITTQLFLQQVLHGNIAVGELRRRSGLTFTDAAYCQARARLPRPLLERLQQSVTDGLCRTTAMRPTELWHGHRVFLLDGSSFSMPDTPALQAQFGQPGGQAQGCGFPVAHLMTRFDAATGLLLGTAALPLRSHDLSGVPALHADLRAGDVLVGDRAFGSYAHLALCRQRGVHGLFRAHQKQIVDFSPHRRHATAQSRKAGQTGLPSSRWLKRLGKHDQLVEYTKPKERPSWLSEQQYAQLPQTLVVREVRYTIAERKRRTRVITLVTTLLDPKRYPAKDLAKLYGLRWTVETNLRHLKQTLHLDVLRCQTVEGVLKELTLFVLIYNLVRRVMWAAARRQKVAVERISFIDAWRWLRYAQPGDALPELVINPERLGRAEPRVRKRRPKEFPVMKRPRAQLRKEMFKQKVTA
ncbi:MAG TPA: IS4 family transposase [Chloroflexota bacterium]|nr:IS4 family transposase [Chloroflexota bacterium]